MTTSPQKMVANIPVSEEVLMNSWGPTGRRGHTVNHTPPTEKDWQRHREAAALLAEYEALKARMDANDCIAYDYDDGTPSVTEPTGRSGWEWTETREEWRKRVGLDRDTP